MKDQKDLIAALTEQIKFQAIKIEDLNAYNNYLRFMISEIRIEGLQPSAPFAGPTKSEREYDRRIDLMGGYITRQEAKFISPRSGKKKSPK